MLSSLLVNILQSQVHLQCYSTFVYQVIRNFLENQYIIAFKITKSILNQFR